MLSWISQTRPAQDASCMPIETFGLDRREVQDMFAPYDAFLEPAAGG
jgi:hypothetical protein